MKQVRIGQNGPRVSALAYGAMSFTDFYGETTEEASHAILDACVELGIDHIDTSNVYGAGRSERFIGSWLAKRSDNPFKIATKAGIQRGENGTNFFNNDPAQLEADLDASLERMGVEQVELFYIHRRDENVPVEEVSGFLGTLITKGKIGSFGFSEIAPTTLRRAHAEHPVAAVQSEYSLQTRSPELGLVQSCAELGTTLVAFCPVGRGLLTDQPPSAEKAAGIAFLKGNPRFIEPNISANLVKSAEFQALAADLSIPAAGLAIAWLLHQGDHVLPIPGTRSVERLKELVVGAQRALSAEELERIEQVLPVGWCHGDRYSQGQWTGPERFC
jgi:aryl-alcohol dehydrogenase-like predicted oxidoreductase